PAIPQQPAKLAAVFREGKRLLRQPLLHFPFLVKDPLEIIASRDGPAALCFWRGVSILTKHQLARGGGAQRRGAEGSLGQKGSTRDVAHRCLICLYGCSVNALVRSKGAMHTALRGHERLGWHRHSMVSLHIYSDARNRSRNSRLAAAFFESSASVLP